LAIVAGALRRQLSTGNRQTISKLFGDNVKSLEIDKQSASLAGNTISASLLRDKQKARLARDEDQQAQETKYQQVWQETSISKPAARDKLQQAWLDELSNVQEANLLPSLERDKVSAKTTNKQDFGQNICKQKIIISSSKESLSGRLLRHKTPFIICCSANNGTLLFGIWSKKILNYSILLNWYSCLYIQYNIGL
jgi:hypothetical protein